MVMEIKYGIGFMLLIILRQYLKFLILEKLARHNIGASNQKNIEIARHICVALNKVYKNRNFLKNIRFVYDRQGHDKRYAINASKIKKLGWKPK